MYNGCNHATGLDSCDASLWVRKAFYRSSSDTHTTGGSLFVKIPLWDPPAVAPDSGIRIARGK